MTQPEPITPHTASHAEPSRVVWAVVSAESISVEQAETYLSSEALAASGALVTFAGVVRNHDHGKGVERLHYEAHPSAAIAITEVAHSVASRFTGRDRVEIAVAHRVGDLQIGDAALVAVVASPHRKAAFEACALLVDDVKRRVPIWKHQHFSDGTDEWVHAIG
ncbi:molybdenum cofactor biosynthesis protein MoaE [Micrococcales bacterium 31B]|nr:molybdenum cofactor biosynthesis protein MoaE [Micrococcales bacterium 31B]